MLDSMEEQRRSIENLKKENHKLREVRTRELSIDNLLVRIHFIIVMIRWTGFAPWEFEFPFPGSLTSTHPQALPQPTWDSIGAVHQLSE